jgi:hypothetical protein
VLGEGVGRERERRNRGALTPPAAGQCTGNFTKVVQASPSRSGSRKPAAAIVAPPRDEPRRPRHHQVTEDRYAPQYAIAIARHASDGFWRSSIRRSSTSPIPHMMGNLGARSTKSRGYPSATYRQRSSSSRCRAGCRRILDANAIWPVRSRSSWSRHSSAQCASLQALWLVFWRVVQERRRCALSPFSQATLFEAFPPAEVAIGQACSAWRHGRSEARSHTGRLDYRQL